MGAFPLHAESGQLAGWLAGWLIGGMGPLTRWRHLICGFGKLGTLLAPFWLWSKLVFAVFIVMSGVLSTTGCLFVALEPVFGQMSHNKSELTQDQNWDQANCTIHVYVHRATFYS